jgi:hypothetical protein
MQKKTLKATANARIISMRRFISVVLIFVLTLQFAWAATARYCDHEYVSGSSHFGHHTHEHLGQSTANASGNGTQYTGGDMDCGTCHLGIGTAFMAMLSVSMAESKETFFSGTAHRIKSASSDIPYRPNWPLPT